MSDRYEMSERNAVEDEAGSSLSSQDLAREGGDLLPDKEVLSILDLFVNIDLAIDLAAPIDLAVAANANVAAPIDAAATANVLTLGSEAVALAQQGVLIDQHISGEAIAHAPQDAVIDQSNDVIDAGGTDATSGAAQPLSPGDTGAVTTTEAVDGTAAGLLDGPLLNVNVDVDIDADAAAPTAGAVALNANAAAPIDAAVAANIATADSESTAIAEQTAIINQDLDDVSAQATAEQTADISQ